MVSPANSSAGNNNVHEQQAVGVSARGPASFGTQTNALVRKNLTFQKRNLRTNTCLIIFPLVLCLLLFALQKVIDNELQSSKFKCGCQCIPNNGTSGCTKVCSIQYSDSDQAPRCAINNPVAWPAFLQVPDPRYRAVKSASNDFSDLPESSCLSTFSCPISFLYTGQNASFADALASNLIPDDLPTSTSDPLQFLSVLTPGTDTYPQYSFYIEPAVLSPPLYVVRPSCPANLSLPNSFRGSGFNFPIGGVRKVAFNSPQFQCVKSQLLKRDDSSTINKELFEGYYKANSARKINEYAAAYDFMNSNQKNFNVTIHYNSTFRNETANNQPSALLRLPRSINLASQAFLRLMNGSNLEMPLEFVKEMPKPETVLSIDFASILGPLFFMWVIQLLFPVILTSLVYEKEKNLRIMMKIHGLGDGPYWLITYAYFLTLSIFYMVCFIIFGSGIGLKFFTLNDYGIQAVFYFVYINLQIALGFLAAIVFNRVKIATIVGYKYVFGFGMLAAFLFQFLVEDQDFPRGWVRVIECLPGFALYRGLYEFGDYALTGARQGTKGMRWSNLDDPANGMREVLIIMSVEWLIILPISYYLDQVVSTGSGIRRHPLFFLSWIRAQKKKKSFRKPSLKRSGSKIAVEMEKEDVAGERVRVEEMLQEDTQMHSIICDNLRKVYPSQDGGPPKYAVHGLTLGVSKGECFGMLGPNGAGKTTSISMMTGLLPPTSGTAYIEGMDIRADMDKIYASMGVCPQHDLIWETLTGREHLLFYGRLKNLKGEALQLAVEESLKSVDLYNGGVGNKQSGKYSGGMKRRLSVAISLIGDPKVVYMDEPSTGLDPASRNKLWNVVKQAKKNRAIILTTHSMEEAEVLCDRMGIFVDGRLQCIGNAGELKSRYGGSYVLTVTTSPEEEEQIAKLVEKLSTNSKKVYSLSGTQKFELPKPQTKIADVFRMITNAKRSLFIQAWGLADTTLEDVFIKVARDAQAVVTLS